MMLPIAPLKGSWELPKVDPIANIRKQAFPKKRWEDYKTKTGKEYSLAQKLNMALVTIGQRPSTVIYGVDYNQDNGTLKVNINSEWDSQVKKSGEFSTYEYYNVPADIILQWAQAPSLGIFYNHNIRNNYTYRRIK